METPRRQLPAPYKVVLGIDPGQKGGIAVLGANEGEVGVLPMPADVAELAAYLSSVVWSRAAGVHAYAFVERAQAMPKQGVSSMFTYGRHFGTIEGILHAMRVPYTLVRPQEWQKWAYSDVSPLLEGKARSIDAARAMHPSVALRGSPRCRKDSDGLADALLIASYGAHKLFSYPR